MAEQHPGLAARRGLLAGGTGLASLGTAATEAGATRPGAVSRLVSVTDFGARGDGVADDTAAFERALKAGAGGAVLVPPGWYAVRPDRLRLPSSTSLLGYGRNSVIRRSAPGLLLDISGRTSADRRGGCLLRDLMLDGGRSAGTLVRCWYAHDLIFDNVWSEMNAGIGIDGVELWDSRFVNCTWNWCSGSAEDTPSVLLRNQPSEAANSLENTNAIYFVNCRWESFKGGALWMQQVGRAAMSQVYLVNCKMETSYVLAPFLRIPPGARNIVVQNLYLCGNSFDMGHETPVDLIELSGFAQIRFENVAVWLNAPVARTVVRAAVGHPSCSIENIWVDGSANPTVAVIESLGSVRAQVTRVGFLKALPGVVER